MYNYLIKQHTVLVFDINFNNWLFCFSLVLFCKNTWYPGYTLNIDQYYIKVYFGGAGD